MFTARETISPIVTSETTDCTPMTLFAIGVSGIVSVGRERRRVRQRHVQVVDELRPPVERLDAVVGHLREQEVGRAVVPRRAPAGAAAVDLPVPQGEDQEVGQPDQHARDDQLAPVGDVVVQQEVRQRDQREDVGGAHERGQRERDAPAALVLVLELARGGHRQADQQHASSAGISHVGPTVSRCGSASCRTIAASTVSCAGQNGSPAAGGG